MNSHPHPHHRYRPLRSISPSFPRPIHNLTQQEYIQHTHETRTTWQHQKTQCGNDQLEWEHAQRINQKTKSHILSRSTHLDTLELIESYDTQYPDVEMKYIHDGEMLQNEWKDGKKKIQDAADSLQSHSLHLLSRSAEITSSSYHTSIFQQHLHTLHHTWTTYEQDVQEQQAVAARLEMMIEVEERDTYNQKERMDAKQKCMQEICEQSSQYNVTHLNTIMKQQFEEWKQRNEHSEWEFAEVEGHHQYSLNKHSILHHQLHPPEDVIIHGSIKTSSSHHTSHRVSSISHSMRPEMSDFEDETSAFERPSRPRKRPIQTKTSKQQQKPTSQKSSSKSTTSKQKQLQGPRGPTITSRTSKQNSAGNREKPRLSLSEKKEYMPSPAPRARPAPARSSSKAPPKPIAVQALPHAGNKRVAPTSTSTSTSTSHKRQRILSSPVSYHDEDDMSMISHDEMMHGGSGLGHALDQLMNKTKSRPLARPAVAPRARPRSPSLSPSEQTGYISDNDSIFERKF